MSDFKLHDLVRVKEQPKMQNVQIKGLMAVITEIEGDHCVIHELQLDGRNYGGSGAVPLSCLEHPKASAPGGPHTRYTNSTLSKPKSCSPRPRKTTRKQQSDGLVPSS